MANMTVDRAKCKGCGLCVTVCPKKLIVLRNDIRTAKGYNPAECTDVKECTGCGMCFLMCPDCAIKVER